MKKKTVNKHQISSLDSWNPSYVTSKIPMIIYSCYDISDLYGKYRVLLALRSILSPLGLEHLEELSKEREVRRAILRRTL